MSDKRLLGYIRRVNLDIMWSRERSTVGNTLSAVKKARDLSVELGLKPQNLLLGPWPVGDDQGFQVEIEMILYLIIKFTPTLSDLYFSSLGK